MKSFVDKIVELDNIRQWEERDSVIKESVSQHSYKVSAICVFLLERITRHSPDFSSVFKLNCLEYCILHDFDESIFGRDVSHVVKYNSFNGGDIRSAISEFVEFSLKKMELNFLFIHTDEDVKMFCKLCDWIALYTFVSRNINTGSKTFGKDLRYCLENIEKKRVEVEEMLNKRFGIKFNFTELINNLTQ